MGWNNYLCSARNDMLHHVIAEQCWGEHGHYSYGRLGSYSSSSRYGLASTC